MSMKKPHPNGKRKRRNDVAPDSYVFSCRLTIAVVHQLRVQAEKEHRSMANLAAMLIETGLKGAI